MHGASFGEIARQSAPGTAGTLQIEDGAKDIVQIHFARCRAFTGIFQEREKEGKLCATYVAWIGFSVHADSLQQRL